jgi:hypothetical protein
MFRFWRLCFIKHAEARVEEMDSSMHGPWDPVFLPSHCLGRACQVYPNLDFTMCFTVVFGFAGTGRSQGLVQVWGRSGVLGLVQVQDWEGGAQEVTGSRLVSTASNDFQGRTMEKFVEEGNVPWWNLHSADSVLLYLPTKISKKEALMLHILKKSLLSPMDTSLHRASGPQYLLFLEEWL